MCGISSSKININSSLVQNQHTDGRISVARRWTGIRDAERASPEVRASNTLNLVGELKRTADPLGRGRTSRRKSRFGSRPGRREGSGQPRARCTTIVVVCRLSKSAIVSVYPWPVFAHWAVTVAGSVAPIGSLAAFLTVGERRSRASTSS